MNRRRFIRQSAVAAATGLGAVAALPAATAANSRRPVRVAVVGVTHPHAAGKLLALQDLSADFEIAGVVEPDERLRRKLASHPKLRQPRWLSEDEAFRLDVAQAALVETAVRDFVPTARRCVDAGLHVHLEKPAGESLDDFAALLDAARDRNLHVQMGYMFRYNPAFQFCLQAVRDGWLGDVFEISGTISKQILNEDRRELAEYRGGVMFELGSHLIDFAVALLGLPDRVTAVGVASRPQQDSLLDNQLAVLHYPRAIASIRSSALEPQGQNRRQLKVAGDQGTVEIRPFDPPALSLSLERAAGEFPAGEHVPKLPPAAGRYHDQLAEFAAVIRDEREPAFSMEHDLAVQRTVLEASKLS